MNPANVLCYEMNGGRDFAGREWLSPAPHRAPAGHGIANVKWLTRIEVVNQRFLNRSWAAITSRSVK